VCIGNEESILEKLIEVAAIKEQGRLEIEEHKALNAEAERTRREILSLRTVSLQTTQPTICTHQNRATEKSQGRPVGQGRE
jgi:regulator of replication initiation timing